MKKVIGWIRFLIGIWLLIIGVISLLSIADASSLLTPAWIATLTGLYFVLGAYKHMMK
jgi:hypothetical protein